MHYLKKESNYVGSWDLWSDEQATYEQWNMTISHIVFKTNIKDIVGKKEAFIAYFVETNLKPMVLNVTNRKVLFQLTRNKNLNDWKNVPITVYVEENIKSPQGLVDALRLKQQVLTPEQAKANKAAYDKAIQDSLTKLDECKTLDELKTVYMGLANKNEHFITAKKDELKTIL